MSLREIMNDACSDLEDRWNDGQVDREEPHETISEIADSAVPIYTADLMQMGADNLELATTEPEIGPAFDGKPTPVNIIAANIYEAVESALWEKYRALKEEADDAEEVGA